MPFLDVSDLLDDPDFADDTGTLGVFIQQQSVDDHGIATNCETFIPLEGVIAQGRPNTLERLAEGSRIKGSITVYTRYRLTDGADGRDADEIGWCGKRYVVSVVSDWSTFGEGFVSAECDLKPLGG